MSFPMMSPGLLKNRYSKSPNPLELYLWYWVPRWGCPIIYLRPPTLMSYLKKLSHCSRKSIPCSYICFSPHTSCHIVKLCPIVPWTLPCVHISAADPILYLMLKNCVPLSHQLGPVFLHLPQTQYFMSHCKTVSHCPMNLFLYLPQMVTRDDQVYWTTGSSFSMFPTNIGLREKNSIQIKWGHRSIVDSVYISVAKNPFNQRKGQVRGLDGWLFGILFVYCYSECRWLNTYMYHACIHVGIHSPQPTLVHALSKEEGEMTETRGREEEEVIHILWH